MSVKAFFTVRGSNPVSTQILLALQDKKLRDPQKYPTEFWIFESESEAYRSASPEMVAVYDTSRYEIRRYKPTESACLRQRPDWIGSAAWIVLVNPGPFRSGFRVREGGISAEDAYKTRIDNCADQLRSLFITNFQARRNAGLLPWEAPGGKKKSGPAADPQPARVRPAGERRTHVGWGLKSLRCYG